MGVKDYDLNPDNNTLINGINIAEGCPPSGINNAIRQLMADVKADSDAQNEALKNFSETPASAEELGPVKVGDGLTMGEDGTLSLDLVDGVDSTSTTQAATANAVKTAYDKAVAAEAAIANALPVGALLPSFVSSMNGCLLCNGAAVSRTTYADLFALLGTAFGKGDGSTTFNLPDFRDKTLWGANNNLMKIISAGAPNINGIISNLVSTSNEAGANRQGAFEWNRRQGVGIINVLPGQGYRYDPIFNASWSSPVYGNSETIQPPAIAVNIFIKY